MMEKYKDTITRIKPVAEAFIREHNITHPMTNPLQTASDMGYYIIKAEAPQNLSGFYMKKDKYPFIFVNSAHSLGRQNFSLWHEVYHHHMNHENGISDFNSKSIEEREAEIFAGCLMLPDEVVRQSVASEIDAELIAQVSDKYRMSFSAVAVRLMQEQYISYEEYKSLKVLSNQSNAGTLRSVYEKQSLPIDILLPSNDVKISANIMAVLKLNYDNEKVQKNTLNEIIQRIEGLKYD